MLFQKISIFSLQKGLEFLGGGGGEDSVRPKNLKKCMKLNWEIQRGGRVLEKIPSVGEVWIFSGITQSAVMTSGTLISQIHCTLLANQKRVRESNV